MSDHDSIHEYLNLANAFYVGHVTEAELPTASISLPLFDENTFEQVVHFAENVASTQPRLGWSILFVAYQASVMQNCDLFLQSRTAWNLAHAANAWVQPHRVVEAISIARRGFAELNEVGWLFACDWQENALAWTKPNFAEATQKLNDALIGLEQNGFDEYVPECRLSLAYAQILTGAYDDALANIQRSEAVYRAHGDTLNQARCWLHHASLFRRQDHFSEAYQQLEQALIVFEQEQVPVDQAKVIYQMALGHLLKIEDLPLAIQYFQRAAEIFKSIELDVWYALCMNNLGSVYLFTGELTLADQYLQQAGNIFAQHEISGSLADNLNDHGEVNILRGKPHSSVEQFKKSIMLNESLGAQLSAAVVTTNLGKAYGQQGRYQDALFHLECAAENLDALESHLRLGTCEKYEALIWSQLGQPAMTHEHLERASHNYEAAEQKAMLADIYNVRATAFFQQGQDEKAVTCLRDALTISQEFGVRPQTALARRLLGEALTRTGEYTNALEYLRQAYADFSEMDMQMDLAACLVALGTCYVSVSDLEQAQSAFQQALELSEGVLPEIEWRAQIGLGDLTCSQAKTGQALKHYRQAVQAFSQIRQNFWQPSLAGSYLQQPSKTFDKIILFAASVGVADDVLFFIEIAKSSTLLGRLLSDDSQSRNSTSQELTDIESEILFLQDELRSLHDKPFPFQAGSATKQIRAKLAEKTELFERVKAQIERRNVSEHQLVTSWRNYFDVSQFQASASFALDKNWIALDYYQTVDELIIVAIAADLCEVTRVPLTQRIRMALDVCKRASLRPDVLKISDLDVLGKALLPVDFVERITPETTLLIAPHAELYAVPWAALRLETSSKFLVETCKPVIVPSLQSLEFLWQRDRSLIGKSSNGLAVGLSSFDGKRRDLPFVKDEIEFLSKQVGKDGTCLAEEDASWEKLVTLKQLSPDEMRRGLSRFDWLHIASHFFSHAQTGRLSGLVLRDGDVWLDRLRDLAPLPNLVTISACNSLSSFVYEGDEHVDLPSTCLVAGAQQVVGSIWPVLDNVAAEFTRAFYTYYLQGLHPADAVTKVQRDMLSRGVAASHWAGFLCLGVP